MSDPLWYKDAVIYELHVRAFFDSSGDGIGDFRGLREKLSYFQDLGVTALWLLPFYPSPLRDDGYDIADYYAVNPSYGTLDDFRRFLDEAHRRDLRVITELVINHTSDQHAWFQRARRAPAGSPERDFYVWSDTPRRFEEARIIFKDFESSNWAWDPVAQAYYWHRFYSHQPDLNFDHAPVREAVIEVMDFWLGMGVDGLRLDAIPYLFEREGTSCENLPETHAYLAELRAHVDRHHPGTMLLAEANQWPEDAVRYFGNGDECHMSFHFPLMPRLFMGIQMEDRFPIIDILDQTPPIPEGCQWAIFLRNHDELTLEMVTDEERDYMYRLYAEDPRARINLGIRRRLAPLLDNNRRKIELINSLLLSLPGTPILYYGDEIGMGDNFYLGDRNGVRTPMQWSADRNAGFSRANPQQLFLPVIIDPEFHYEAVNVDMQVGNLSSLFWWTRRVIDIRKRHPAFSRGSIEFLRPSNAKVLAYLRHDAEETILVVANLSRFSQAVSLDLSAYAGRVATELFSGDRLLEISEIPAFFTVGPHGFYWIQLSGREARTSLAERAEPPVLAGEPTWTRELAIEICRRVLPDYLPSCRWYGHKQRVPRTITLEALPGADSLRVLLVELSFADTEPVTQVVPLAIGEEAESDSAGSVVARFSGGRVLHDALAVPSCRQAIWQLIAEGGVWTDGDFEIRGTSGQAGSVPAASRLLGGEQSNSTIAYEDRHLLKFLRKFEAGRHPDAEILGELTRRGFAWVPPLTGEIRCRTKDGLGLLGLMTSYVPNEGDGWTQALDAISRYFDRVSSSVLRGEEFSFEEMVGANFPQRARQLGERTGALHNCLAGMDDLPNFAPEPFTALFQRSLYQSMRSQLRRTEAAVTRKLEDLDLETRQKAMSWIAATPRILEAYEILLRRRFAAQKIRVHGDFHLGQVLNTGNDFIILDFEGEPRKGLGERLLKRPPLVDVAGMLRSFDYAVEASLLKQRDPGLLRPWALRWLEVVSREFLQGYRSATAGASYLPEGRDFEELLDLFILDKAVYEIGYEMNYRPAFLPIPIAGAARILLPDSPPSALS